MNNIEVMKLALQSLEQITRHFTRVPSTLADTTVRGDAHKTMAELRQAIEHAEQVQPLTDEQIALNRKGGET